MSNCDSNTKVWKVTCNRKQRHNNNQNVSVLDEDDLKAIKHYKKTEFGDIWHSCYDEGEYWRSQHTFKFNSKNWNRDKGHDKKKPWRDKHK